MQDDIFDWDEQEDRFDNLAGRTLSDRYRLDRLIGKGGFGAVYEAFDQRMKARRAVKVVDPKFRILIRREATIGQISHPNIVRYLDFELEGIHPFVVMEYLQGRSLDRIGILGENQITQFIREIGSALQQAHKQRRFHRDLKPQNVMLVDEDQRHRRFVILDFGIASQAGASVTVVGETMAGAGTLEYMSPEQMQAKPATPQFDIYAFGVLLYRLITGAVPFPVSERNLYTYHDYLLSTTAPGFSEELRQSEFLAALEGIVLRCLSRNPDQRPASMSALLDEVERVCVPLLASPRSSNGSWNGEFPPAAGTDTGEAADPHGLPTISPSAVTAPPGRIRDAETSDWLPSSADSSITVGNDRHTNPFPARELADTAPYRPAELPQHSDQGELTIPGYELFNELGRGATGVVFRARDLKLNRMVALKFLQREHSTPKFRDRFRGEAKAVATLQHPGIVQIYEVGEFDHGPYCALEYIPGGNLERQLGSQPLEPREAARITQLLAVAVQHAHERGILHRDLKPSNILLNEQREPKITDFGLAKQLEEYDVAQTREGQILGTPSFMSPEQAAGRVSEIGPAADIYALGAILFTMLVGRPPFEAESVTAMLAMVRSREPHFPAKIQSRIPRDLRTICLKCLNKDAGRRYRAAADLAADLERFLRNQPLYEHDAASGASVRLSSTRVKLLALTGVAGALTAVLFAMLMSPPNLPSTGPRPESRSPMPALPKTASQLVQKDRAAEAVKPPGVDSSKPRVPLESAHARLGELLAKADFSAALKLVKQELLPAFPREARAFAEAFASHDRYKDAAELLGPPAVVADRQELEDGLFQRGMDRFAALPGIAAVKFAEQELVPAFPSRAAELQLGMARVELQSARLEAAETRVGKILQELTASEFVPDLLSLRGEARLKRAEPLGPAEAIPLLSSAIQDFDDAARQQTPGDATRVLAAQARLQRGLARWDELQSRSVAGVMEWGPELVNAACDLRAALPDLDDDQTRALQPVERRCQQEVETLRSCLGKPASTATDTQYRAAVNWLSLAITLWPKNPQYVYYRGIAYSEPNFTTPDYERAIKDLRHFDALIGNDTTAESLKKRINGLNRLALIWATCPESQLRDGKAAVESAKRARSLCQMLAEDELALRLRANVSLALAAAHAEVGDFEAAVRDVEQIRDELSDQPGEQFRQMDAEFKFLGQKFSGGTPYRDARKWVPQDDPFVCTMPTSPPMPAKPAETPPSEN